MKHRWGYAGILIGVAVLGAATYYFWPTPVTESAIRHDPTLAAEPMRDPDAGAGSGCPDFPPLTLQSLHIETDQAVSMAVAPGDDALFFTEKNTRRIVVYKDGKLLNTPFLSVPHAKWGGEQGLLGMAFHPDYEENGRFFIYYTDDKPRRDVVAEYRRSEDNPYVAHPTEVRRLIEPKDSESNHNGGMITFGPDGFLYVGMGDEGGAGDKHGPHGNGLNTQTLYGAMLRLDVDNVDGGFAASGNPFNAPALPQIWAYGLRNPWRFSFDAKTGDLWIADVGQDKWEEINFVPAGKGAGWNFGWRAYEGTHVFSKAELRLVEKHAAPLLEYPHEQDEEHLLHGFSVTGGYVYRGSAIKDLQGVYLYGDFATGLIAGLRMDDDHTICRHRTIPELKTPGLASFGEDAKGELYILTLNDGVHRLLPASK